MGSRELILLRTNGFLRDYEDEVSQRPNLNNERSVLTQLVYLIQNAKDAFMEQHPGKFPKGMELIYPDSCRFLVGEPDVAMAASSDQVAGEIEACEFFNFSDERIYQLADAIALDLEESGGAD